MLVFPKVSLGLVLPQGFGLCVCEDEGLPGKSPDHLLEKEGREQFAG